jgi:acetyltransferase-like isoleucine patch superfamily enzyme
MRTGRFSYVHPTTQIIGRANVFVGDNSSIGERTWINVNDRSSTEIAVYIGTNCFIGRENFFSSGRVIHLSDYCLTTIGCKFICSTHVVDDPAIPYIASGTTSHESIKVGTNCFFGADSTVLGNITIGHGSVIGAGSMVITDIPAFSLVVGNPAKVIKRYSFSKKAWCPVDNLTDADLLGNPDEDAYLSSLKEGYAEVLMPWIAAGSDLGDL